MGKDFVGDAPLSKKILAGLTTGEHIVGVFVIFFFFLIKNFLVKRVFLF